MGGMRMTRGPRAALMALGASCALAVAGCTGEASPQQSVAPSGDVVHLEPADLTPAELVEHAGVSIQVPPDATVQEASAQNETVIFTVTLEGGEIARLVVTQETAGTDRAVQEAALVAQSGLLQRGAAEVDRRPAQWSVSPSAVAVRAVLEEEGTEVFAVQLRDEAGSMLVGVAAEVPEGTLEESLAYQVVRTLQLPD